jgi:hypothetical protein
MKSVQKHLITGHMADGKKTRLKTREMLHEARRLPDQSGIVLIKRSFVFESFLRTGQKRRRQDAAKNDGWNMHRSAARTGAKGRAKISRFILMVVILRNFNPGADRIGCTGGNILAGQAG